MFKGFQDTSKSQMFHGFPNLNFQLNNEAYGFSGCTFWLDAAYGLNTQTNLAAVSSWKDRISGIDFTQTTAGNQPRLIVADSNFNNLPSIQFQDTARFMTTDTFISPEYTIVTVAKYDTLVAVNGLFGSTEGVNSTGVYVGGTLAGVVGITVFVASTNSLTGTTESSTSKIGVITETEIVVNGTQEATGSFTWDRAFNQIGRVRVSTNSLSGRIAEILIFKNKLTSSQCIEISTNINSKYALY